MDSCKHRVATIIAEFDDARAEKLKKNQTSTTQILFNFSQNVDNRQRKWDIYLKKYGVTEYLRELDQCIDIEVPTSALYLHISSTARARSMHDVAWHSEVNCVRSKDAQK